MATTLTGNQQPRGSVLEHAVDIRKPPQVVFDYCSDLTREPEWNPKLKRVEKQSDGPAGVGTRYKAEFVSGDPMTVEYVRFERPTAWSTIGNSRKLQVSFTGEVQPTDKGARLVLRMDLRPQRLPLLRSAAPAPVHVVAADAERVGDQGGAGGLRR